MQLSLSPDLHEGATEGFRNQFESVAQPGPNPFWSAEEVCANADPGTRNHYWG